MKGRLGGQWEGLAAVAILTLDQIHRRVIRRVKGGHGRQIVAGLLIGDVQGKY